MAAGMSNGRGELVIEPGHGCPHAERHAYRQPSDAAHCVSTPSRPSPSKSRVLILDLMPALSKIISWRHPSASDPGLIDRIRPAVYLLSARRPSLRAEDVRSVWQ